MHEQALNARFRGGTFAVGDRERRDRSKDPGHRVGTRAREIAGLHMAESARPRIFHEVSLSSAFQARK